MKRPWITVVNVLLSVAAIGLLGLSAARVTEGFLLEVDGSGLPAKTASAPLQPRSFTERSV
ncbi:MAG TPA: hypothetical protein VII78_18420, partial [Myxococcota bacterium]